jgi:gamma-glutamyl-gamma-aminobutyrate hydrolase PuuD
MRPAIGITVSFDTTRKDFFSLRRDYVRAVGQSGGLPVLLAPGNPEDAGELLGRVDGLLLTGGTDVDPALYGEPAHPSVTPVFRERDEFEIALCQEALRQDLPLLAICRGHQVLNVARGGTLIQDIPSEVEGSGNHDPERERWEPAHDVRVEPGTRLHLILGRERVEVNSFHHQAVDTLGERLVASAWSTADGVVEGIEAADRRFAIGVQWHPEAFWNRTPGFHSLFEALVGAGAGRLR